jgi:hypothetical protein
MLPEMAHALDAWVARENRVRQREGSPGLPKCRIRLLGQMALFEQKVPLALVATNDVDVVADYPFPVEREFRRLVEREGKFIDPTPTEIWMPPETQYRLLVDGRWVRLEVAEVDAVLLSKALKAPEKNRQLVVEYLARGASSRFFDLADRHGLDLEAFL